MESGGNKTPMCPPPCLPSRLSGVLGGPGVAWGVQSGGILGCSCTPHLAGAGTAGPGPTVATGRVLWPKADFPPGIRQMPFLLTYPLELSLTPRRQVTLLPWPGDKSSVPCGDPQVQSCGQEGTRARDHRGARSGQEMRSRFVLVCWGAAPLPVQVRGGIPAQGLAGHVVPGWGQSQGSLRVPPVQAALWGPSGDLGDREGEMALSRLLVV